MIMIANFGDESVTLLRGQQIASSDPRHSASVESPITHEELFGIDENERHTYKRRASSPRDTALNNKYPADSRNHMNEEEKPVIAEDNHFRDIDMKFHHINRNMSGMHGDM